MRNMNTIIKKIVGRVYDRLLSESVSSSNRAALVDNGSRSKRAVIYNISRLMQYVKAGGDFNNPEDVVDYGIVEGYIMIEKPRESCNRAWEVKFSVGPGLGKMVYGVGYAMSPSGALISDRQNVSSAARTGWNKAYGGETRSKKPLDDFRHPASGENEFHGRHHTEDDKSDDCKTFGNADYLNYSYSSEGWEKPMLRSLEASHDGVITMLAEINMELPLIFTRRIFAAANHFFDTHYEAEA